MEANHLPVPEILKIILGSQRSASDVFFSPGRPPQVEVGGALTPVEVPGLSLLTADDTARLAAELIGPNRTALEKLSSEGSCDVSYAVTALARFRVNVFSQRGSRAIVMRVIPSSIPSLESLGLPVQLGEIVGLVNGMVLVTGPADRVNPQLWPR